MKKYYGVTIVELLIVLFLVSMLATFAAPSFTNSVKSNRITSGINKFTSSMAIARSEAIKRASNVTVCRSGDGTDCANGGDWTQGWLVFVDIDGDGALEAADGDEALVVQRAFEGATTSFTASANAAARVTFNSRGFAPGFSATFTLCDDRGNAEAKAVIISNTGRVQRAVDTDADEIENDIDGNNLTC